MTISGSDYNLPGAENPRSKWTREVRAEIGRLMLDGLSASQIGERYGVRRGAINGLVYRDPDLKQIGFASANDRKAIQTPRRRTIEPPRFPAHKPEPVEAPDDAPEPKWLSMPDLGPRQCRWPVSPDDVAPTEHRFCGHETDEGKSYCPHHAERSVGPGTRAENMAFKQALASGEKSAKNAKWQEAAE